MKTLTKVMLLVGAALLIAGFSFRTPVQRLDDTRFLKNGSMVGKKTEEVVNVIGQPKDKTENGCQVPVYFNGRKSQITGDNWAYESETDQFDAELQLCVVHGVVVGEKTKTAEDDNGRITVSNIQVVDTALAKTLFISGMRPPDAEIEDHARKIEI